MAQPSRMFSGVHVNAVNPKTDEDDMKTTDQLNLQPGLKVTWENDELSLMGWHEFLEYAGPGPFEIVSISRPPCSCGMTDGAGRNHAPGCLTAVDTNAYLTLAKPDGSLIRGLDGQRPVMISAEFLRVVGL